MNAELRAQRDALEYLWRQGLSGRALLAQHSQLIDDSLVACFSGCPEAGEDMALVALGGYGRKELFPYSDIDLLLLHGPAAENRLAAVGEALFYPLWNAGLEVGHGVRTVDACLEHAREDFFFQVALLDARLLAGSTPLFAELRHNFQERILDGHRQEFLEKMMLHRKERHQRYGIHSYQLEPHVKESRGGFRDIQAILWVARALFGLQNLDDMEEAGLLDQREKREFLQAWDHLIRIRNRLHYLSGRKNDQLFLEHQEEVARAFRYEDANGILGVERFMQDVYSHLRTIATTSDLFFEHVDESLGLPQAFAAAQVLETGITVRQNRLHLTDSNLVGRRPYLLMRLFVQAARTGLDIHHRSRKIVTAGLHLVDEKLRRSKRMARAFFEVLEHAGDVEDLLGVMLETGLIAAYLPEFSRILALAQHDVYHVFTVDRHLLRTVAEIKKIGAAETPFAGVESLQVLLLAALLHDIGKGHQDEHSLRGAKLAATIGRRLALSEAEAACLEFLVANHLFLTETALRRDLEDEALIQQCARRIQTPERLAMLHLLAIADARATGPTAWSEWKAALLMELVLRITPLLEQQEAMLPDKSQGARWMLDRVQTALGHSRDFDCAVLPEEYLLAFPPEEVVRHIRLHARLQEEKTALLEHAGQGLFWSVLVMARDRPGLLAKICGTLALHDINVTGAQIFTWQDGTAVDLINVCSTTGQEYSGQDWQALTEDLNQALASRLGLCHRLGNRFRADPYRIGGKTVSAPPRVVLNNETSQLYTIVEVYADNRPGLLYDITRTLAEFEINIHRARISSNKDQIVNVFYVLDGFSTKINNPSFQEEISRALLYIAGNRSGTGAKSQWRQQNITC